ncbi:hypothetical protein [Paenibacillus harenae]|uniref:C1q domain-containing protein n=1 Tax=Paenibacillus harenae TaxID=306543 RepID=A0ABT9U5I8_PAEHA|nr:hypothetical protein [Paenibacillus harenae]MDQ0114905.1 hypothetical protein [Paenibacillus harenae]
MVIKRTRIGKSACKKTVYKKTVLKKTVCRQSFGKNGVSKRFRRINSAFRAVAGFNQELLNGVVTNVRYQVEELDLINEYNPATSTFRPKQNGVYSLFASVSFAAATLIPASIGLEIRVNGVPRILDQEDFISTRGMIDAGGIINLEARDRVQVFARVDDKSVEIQSGVATRFEGARIS